jgi:hypothetical protein
MIMNDQQQLAIIVFFTIPPVSSLTAAQANPREAAMAAMAVEKADPSGGFFCTSTSCQLQKNVLLCVVSRRNPTLEDSPWATPILLKVIWDAKGAICKVRQPRAILDKFWRHKASSLEVLLP